MKLFDEMPRLTGERIFARPFVPADAPALDEFTKDPEVYRYLPTFLYELKYEDKNQVIERMEEECFLTKESILLAVFLKEEPDKLVGILEIYNYEPEKEKASVGCRLAKAWWNKGIAAEGVCLLRDYLFEKTDVRKITAHIMKENIASEKMTEKCGFIKRWPDLTEDWGFDSPVIVDKYSCKKEWLAGD